MIKLTLLTLCVLLALGSRAQPVRAQWVSNANIYARQADYQAELVTRLQNMESLMTSTSMYQRETNDAINELLRLQSSNLTTFREDFADYNYSYQVLTTQLRSTMADTSVVRSLVEHMGGVVNSTLAEVDEFDQECYCVTPDFDLVNASEELGNNFVIKSLSSGRRGVCWMDTEEGLRPRYIWKPDSKTRWVSEVQASSAGVSISDSLTCKGGPRHAAVFWDYYDVDDVNPTPPPVNRALATRYVGNKHYRSLLENRPSLSTFTRERVRMFAGTTPVELYQCRLNQWTTVTQRDLKMYGLVGIRDPQTVSTSRPAPAFDGTDPYAQQCSGYTAYNVRCDIKARSYYGFCRVVWNETGDPFPPATSTTEATTTTAAPTPTYPSFLGQYQLIDPIQESAPDAISGATITRFSLVITNATLGLSQFRVSYRPSEWDGSLTFQSGGSDQVSGLCNDAGLYPAPTEYVQDDYPAQAGPVTGPAYIISSYNPSFPSTVNYVYDPAFTWVVPPPGNALAPVVVRCGDAPYALGGSG